MSKRVLNVYMSLDLDGKFRHFEPGEPWTAALGERITNPRAWVDVAEPTPVSQPVEPTVPAEKVEQAEEANADQDQDESDGDEPVEVPERYKGMKKSELQGALSERGLDESGTVAELLQRLAKDDAATA